MELDHEKYMRMALALTPQNPAAAFAGVIVDVETGAVVTEGINDAGANAAFHGEIVTLNRCAQENPGIDWSRLVMYSTAEPCPMCMSAILWIGFRGVVFGTSIPTLIRLGWDQIPIRAEYIVGRTSWRECLLIGGVLEEECDRLFDVPDKLYGGAEHRTL